MFQHAWFNGFNHPTTHHPGGPSRPVAASLSHNLGLISGSLIPKVLRDGLPELCRSRCPHPLILIASRREGAVNVKLPGFSATQDNDADGLTGGQVK
jgi:hypothetical protein